MKFPRIDGTGGNENEREGGVETFNVFAFLNKIMYFCGGIKLNVYVA